MPNRALPPWVHCQACGRPLPRLLINPIPQTLVIQWHQMLIIERQLLAGIMIWHCKGNEYSTWSPGTGAILSGLTYRQVANSLRRLVPCKWVDRVSRGRYRLTGMTVETLRPLIKGSKQRVTQLRDAQVQAQEDV